MSLRASAFLAMIFSSMLCLPAAAAEPVAEPPIVGTPAAPPQAYSGDELSQASSTSPTVRLAGAGYYGFPGRSYYGRYGFRGPGLYYRSNRLYAYGNPYLYRGGAYLGYGYTTAYRPYLYAPSIYGSYGYGYYRPYLYPPYRYTTPLSLYGVYYAPSYGYGGGVPVSYGGCYYW